MADDRNKPDVKGDKPEKKGESEQKRVIGKGMTSPDSTQVPLKSDTGEPDWDAIKGRIPPNQDKGGPKRPS
jgi:hypothetical protein